MRRSLVALSLIVVASSAIAAGPYAITDLGLMGGAYSLHTAGANGPQSTGYFDSGAGSHAFYHHGSSSTDLGTLGGTFSVGYGVNSLGQVVGQSSLADNTPQAFYYDGSMHHLSFLSNGYASAYAINDNGIIVGQEGSLGFVATSTGLIANMGFGNGYDSALGVNSAGVVAGFGSTPDTGMGPGPNHAWYWDGTLHDMGALIPGGYSGARSISDGGHIVGFANSASGQRGFIWNGSMTQLDPVTGDIQCEAWGVNSSGLAVGSSTQASFQNRATLWESGTAFDLNGLLTGPTGGLIVEEARSISNSGHIFGTARDASGYGHAVILTPVPEPGTWFALSLGGIALLKRRRA